MNLKLHSVSLAISFGCHLVFTGGVANVSAYVRKSNGSRRGGIPPGQDHGDDDADRMTHDSTLDARRMSGDFARMLHEPRMPSMHVGDSIMVESMTDGESVMVGMANPASSNCIDNGFTYQDLFEPTGVQLNSFF